MQTQNQSSGVTTSKVYYTLLGFPGGALVKNPPANAGDMDSSSGPRRSHMPQSN